MFKIVPLSNCGFSSSRSSSKLLHKRITLRWPFLELRVDGAFGKMSFSIHSSDLTIPISCSHYQHIDVYCVTNWVFICANRKNLWYPDISSWMLNNLKSNIPDNQTTSDILGENKQKTFRGIDASQVNYIIFIK